MGKWVFYKRTAEYVLTSADVISLTTTGTNVDYVVINSKADAKSANASIVENQMVIQGFLSEVRTEDYDLATSIGKYVQGTSTFVLIFAKGTYANLAAVQAALTGIKVVYQLAVPLTIEEQDFAQYGIAVEGSLSSNLDYTEYFIADQDIMADVDITYATNIAKAVEQLKDSVDSLNEIIRTTPTETVITTGFASGWSGEIRIRKNQEGLKTIKCNLAKTTTIAFADIPYALSVDYRPISTNADFLSFSFNGETVIFGALTAGFVNTDGNILLIPAGSVTANVRNVRFTISYY